MLSFVQEKDYCACVVDDKQLRALLSIGFNMKSSDISIKLYLLPRANGFVTANRIIRVLCDSLKLKIPQLVRTIMSSLK